MKTLDFFDNYQHDVIICLFGHILSSGAVVTSGCVWTTQAADWIT